MDGRGIVIGVLWGFLAWCAILALLYGFTHLVSFVATVYEQVTTPRLMLLADPTDRLSDKH